MKYKQYQKYKDSGVEWIGEIPEGWEVKKLKFVLEDKISDGPHETPKFLDIGIPFLSVDNIQDDKLYLENLRYISKEDHERFSLKCKPKKNDVLLGKAASVGKVALVDLDLDFNIWSPLAVIRVSQNKISPQFTYFLMKSDFLQTQISLKVNWNTQGNIGMGDIKNLFILQPPYDEQKQIYHFLNTQTNQLDDLISKSQSQVKLLQEKRQTLINHAVTKGLDPTVQMKDSGVEWVGEIPEHWLLGLLKYFVRNVTDGAHISPDISSLGKFFVSTVDIDNQVIDFDNCLKTSFESYEYLVQTGCKPNKNDILFSKDGTIGKTSIVRDDDFVVASSLIIIKPNFDKVTSNYLNFVLQSSYVLDQVESMVKGAALRRVSLKNIKSIGIVLPPLSEGKQITDFLDKQITQLDELIAKFQSQIKMLQEKRQTLITSAVTGKIDVRNGVAA